MLMQSQLWLFIELRLQICK